MKPRVLRSRELHYPGGRAPRPVRATGTSTSVRAPCGRGFGGPWQPPPLRFLRVLTASLENSVLPQTREPGGAGRRREARPSWRDLLGGGRSPCGDAHPRAPHRRVAAAATRASAESLVISEDVFVHFSREEWMLLDEAQRCLYQDVMLEKVALLASLGCWCGAEAEGEDTGDGTIPERRLCLGVLIRTPMAGVETPLYDTKDIFTLTEHQGRNARQKPHACGVCGKQFWFSVNLHLHQHSEEKPGRDHSRVSVKTGGIYVSKKIYIKGDGRMDLPASSGFLQHQASHGRVKSCKNVECTDNFHSRQKHHKCNEFEKVFARKDTLARHQRIHTGERPYECNKCGKLFSQSCDLFKHQTVHTGEKPYECRECGKFFRQVSGLVEHRQVHTGERLFSSKSNLIRHQEVHTGARPYMCSDCGKEFNCKHTLILHQRTHTGEKPYECTECGKTFSQSSHLNVHWRIHGSDYECSKCGKAFSQRPNLIRHWKVHTGERPYVCSDCGKEFNRKHTLVLHQRIHTGKKP